MDFKKVGEAAIAAFQKPDPSIHSEEQYFEAAGRAAMAAMIPEAEPCETFDHQHCNGECPFVRYESEDRPCMIGLGEWHCGMVCPGADCPARKGKEEGRLHG